MTGSVMIRVHRSGCGSAVSEGQFFYSYSVDDFTGDSSGLGRNVVAGTEAEQQQWRTAARRHDAAILDANAKLGKAERRRWLRRLPGGRRRLERARQRYREQTDAATQIYRPVYEEIERRLAAHQGQNEELERQLQIWESQRQEQQNRYRSVGRKAVWGWIVIEKRGTSTVWIFRHDVPANPQWSPPEGARRSEEPLTAAGLEKALLSLAAAGVSEITWDAAARQKVVDECSTPDLPARFDDWWQAVTRKHWPTPKKFPAPDPPRPTRRSGRYSGTSHHSSHGVGGGDGGGGGGGI